jgi:hypothetical protein
LGITGDVGRDPAGGGVPDFTMSNTSAAGELRKAAAELVEPAKLVGTKGAASASATKKLRQLRVI